MHPIDKLYELLRVFNRLPNDMKIAVAAIGFGVLLLILRFIVW